MSAVGRKWLYRSAKGFTRSTSGSTTIEMVIWFPIFMLLFCLIADAALIFSKQAQVLRIVQDANRATSIGRMMSSTDTQSYIYNRVVEISPNANVFTTIDAGVISSTVTMPASDLTATSLIDAFRSLNIRVSSQHLSEA